jgi:hypothetical protein
LSKLKSNFCRPLIWAISNLCEKPPKVNSHPIGVNSPNLVLKDKVLEENLICLLVSLMLHILAQYSVIAS